MNSEHRCEAMGYTAVQITYLEDAGPWVLRPWRPYRLRHDPNRALGIRFCPFCGIKLPISTKVCIAPPSNGNDWQASSPNVERTGDAS